MSNKHVLVWTGNDESVLCNRLKDIDGLVVIAPDTVEDVEKVLKNSHIFITSSAVWNVNFNRALSESKITEWIQLTNAGYDNILKEGVPNNLTISNIGSIGAEAVADHAVGLLYAILRRIPEAIRKDRVNDFGFDSISKNTTTLSGKSIILLGCGNIGKMIARKLKCLGVDLILIARNARYEDELSMDVVSVDTLPSVIKQADGLIVSCSLTEETQNLVGSNVFENIKRDFYLVNVSRGAVINTDALVQAIEKKVIKGAALDVTEPEPLSVDHPLRNYNNVLITPHVAWSGNREKYRKYVEDLIFWNVDKYVKNEGIENVVYEGKSFE